MLCHNIYISSLPSAVTRTSYTTSIYPLSSLLDSINQAASSRSPSAQDVLAHASTINAQSELVASQRTTSAPSKLAAPDSAMSSPEVVRLPRWDKLGRSYTLNHNLVHKFIPSFSFKGTVTKPRSSSSSSSSRVTMPCLSSAALQDGSYQPGRAYPAAHEDRLSSPI